MSVKPLNSQVYFSGGPVDGRTIVATEANITGISNAYVGMEVTVLNNGSPVKYIIKKLTVLGKPDTKANGGYEELIETISNRPAEIDSTTSDVQALGYKVLKKYDPNDASTTFAAQITDENTTYEIRDEFDLGGGSVVIPNNCVLYFNGGKIKNGSVKYQNTFINGKAVMEVSITTGSFFSNNQVDIEWFGAKKYDSTFNNATIINAVASVCKTLYLGYGTWYFSTPITLSALSMFTCDGYLSWNNTSDKNLDTITIIDSTYAKVYIKGIINYAGWVYLRNHGFFDNYGRDWSVRALCVKNSNACDVQVSYISNFNEGIRVEGWGSDGAFNRIHDSQITYTNVGVRITQSSRMYGYENVTCSTPVQYGWRNATLLTIPANTTFQVVEAQTSESTTTYVNVTNPSNINLISSDKTEVIPLTDGAYTPTSETGVYILSGYNRTIQYKIGTTVSSTVTKSEGLAIPYENGLHLMSGKLTPSGTRNLLYNTESSRRCVFMKSGSIYVWKDDYSRTKPYTLPSGEFYIVQPASEEEQQFDIAYIGSRTAGAANNNFVENIRHTNYSEENNVTVYVGTTVPTTIVYKYWNNNLNNGNGGFVEYTITTSKAVEINGTTYYIKNDANATNTVTLSPYVDYLMLPADTVVINEACYALYPLTETTDATYVNKFTGINRVQRVSYLVKGTRWENPNQDINHENFKCDTYNCSNTLYFNNVSCENNRSPYAVIIYNCNESSCYISRAESVYRMFKIEGKCYNLDLDVEYGSTSTYTSDISTQAYITWRGSSYPLIAKYEKGEIEVQGTKYVDKNNRYFINSSSIQQGYCTKLHLYSDSFPTFNLNDSAYAIAFKLRNTAHFNNCIVQSRYNCRIGIRYLTMVENEVERDVELTDMATLIAPPTPYFDSWEVKGLNFNRQNSKTEWKFMIPYNVRNFLMWVYTDSATYNIASIDDVLIRATNIKDVTEPRRHNGTTSERPSSAPIGFIYHDTTVSDDIKWNGKAWEPTKNYGTICPNYLTADNAGFVFYITTRQFPVMWNGSEWIKFDNSQFIEFGGTYLQRPINPQDGQLFEDTACYYTDGDGQQHQASVSQPFVIKFSNNLWRIDVDEVDSDTNETVTNTYPIYDNDATEEDENQQPIWGTLAKRAALGIRARRTTDSLGIQEYQFKMRDTNNTIIRFTNHWIKENGDWYIDQTGQDSGNRTNTAVGKQYHATVSGRQSINGGNSICFTTSTSGSSLLKWGFVGDVMDSSNKFVNGEGYSNIKPYYPDNGYIYHNVSKGYQMYFYNNLWRLIDYSCFYDSSGIAETRLTLSTTYKGYYYGKKNNESDTSPSTYYVFTGFKWIGASSGNDVIDATGTYEELNATENLSTYYNYQCYCEDLQKNIIWKHGVWYYMDEFDEEGNPIEVVIEPEEVDEI